MNLKRHANRYYKSLCTCQYPAPSKFARDICAWCGGIVPHWRRVEVEEPPRRWDFYVVLLMFAIVLALGLLFPSLLDGAINQIGR